MQTRSHMDNKSFQYWLNQNRIVLLIALFLLIIQFYAFKLLYPFPNFLPDSYSYIDAAITKQHVNIWPIGYSKFLLWFSFLTGNHCGLVWFQFLLLQLSVLYFLYTVDALLKPGKILFRVLLFSIVCNPLTLYISNLVSSDALFATMSIVWIAQLMWISYHPTLRLLLLHSIILTLAFTVRYNALYYPFISLAMALLIKMHINLRLIGITAICLLLCAFIGFTQYHYQKETRLVQFSPFGGWQLASNALYAYAHVSKPDRKNPILKYKQLEEHVNRHMDSLQNLHQRPDAELGVYYMWNQQSPLRQDMYYSLKYYNTNNGFKRWAFVGPYYRDFGIYLIKKYPAAFFQYYVRPNLVNFYVPNAEFLTTYNMGRDTLDKKGVEWFNLKSNKVFSKKAPIISHLSRYLPIITALMNLLFIASYIGFRLLNGFINSSVHTKGICNLILFIWFANMAFSVLSSPIVLRYQLFSTIITQTFMLWLMCGIFQLTQTRQMQMGKKELTNMKTRTNAALK